MFAGKCILLTNINNDDAQIKKICIRLKKFFLYSQKIYLAKFEKFIFQSKISLRLTLRKIGKKLTPRTKKNCLSQFTTSKNDISVIFYEKVCFI